LEALGRSTFVLDDWKKKYSNSETPEALTWFWENANLEEYSLWRVNYKYNPELTQVFMSSNLIGLVLPQEAYFKITLMGLFLVVFSTAWRRPASTSSDLLAYTAYPGTPPSLGPL